MKATARTKVDGGEEGSETTTVDADERATMTRSRDHGDEARQRQEVERRQVYLFPPERGGLF